jgi:hypothetical protein
VQNICQKDRLPVAAGHEDARLPGSAKSALKGAKKNQADFGLLVPFLVKGF